MDKDFKRIIDFLDEHHVLSLATNGDDGVSVCNLFYAFDKDTHSFVVASSEDTLHVKHTFQNSNIAGTVVLETKTVGKIQGLQFRGEFLHPKSTSSHSLTAHVEDEGLKKLYFKTFPYALAMNPKLWQIKVNYFKLTDNRLGFGKKIVYTI